MKYNKNSNPFLDLMLQKPEQELDDQQLYQDVQDTENDVNPMDFKFEQPVFDPISYEDSVNSNLQKPELLQGIDTEQDNKEDESVDSASKKEKKPSLESLLQEYMSSKEQRQEDLRLAAERDRKQRLLQGLTNAFSQIGTGLASGYADVKIKPIDLGPADAEARARAEQKERLSDMLSQLKLKKATEPEKKTEGKRYFNTSDGIVEVDQNTGETKLVRESVLAKGREERLKKGQEKSFELKDRPSDKQTERIESVEFASALVDRVEQQLPEVEEYLGPYASRIEAFKSYNPFSEGVDPEFAKFKANAVESLASYIKDKSGAQVSDRERAFLEGALPSVTDKPQEFKAKLDEFKKRLSMVKEGRIESIERQGKDVSEFKKNKKIIRKQYSKSRNKTKITYSDGSTEILDGKQ